MTKKRNSRQNLERLEELPNVGPSIAGNLRLLGITCPADLLGRDPCSLYEKLNEATGQRHDPCVLDVFIAAVRYVGGEPKKPWWKYTAERKQELARRTTTQG